MDMGERLPRPSFLLGGILVASSILVSQAANQTPPQGTTSDPIIDSSMNEIEAFAGLSKECPEHIREAQEIVDVEYVGFDGLIHRGQLIVHRDLVADTREVFALALRERFPIATVIPVSHPRFRRDGRWDDDLSMEANNTSAFNYREVTGGKKLSSHACGRAIDINPALNPYVKGDTVLPRGARYDTHAAGTLTADHPVVQAFKERGWQWGGDWTSLRDYQHFERPSPD